MQLSTDYERQSKTQHGMEGVEIPIVTTQINNSNNIGTFEIINTNNKTNGPYNNNDEYIIEHVKYCNKLPPGFLNEDNVSCYCNVVIQVMFNENKLLGYIITFDPKSPLGKLAKHYLQNCTVSLYSYSIRKFVVDELYENTPYLKTIHKP